MKATENMKCAKLPSPLFLFLKSSSAAKEYANHFSIHYVY